VRNFLVLIAAVTVSVKCMSQSDSSNAFAPYEQPIAGTGLSFKMVPIPAGEFLMGSADTEKGHKPAEGPQKKVNVSGFWMGVYEVTHDEFAAFFNDETVSRNSDVDAVTRPTSQYIDLSWGMGKQGGFPFNSMSQHTALMFCKWLYKKTGVFYRLPTEAEWEYACRAGTKTAYFFGDDPKQLDDYAWYAGNSSNKYHKVGTKKPNPWGLYDMLGNVSEWTLDQYDENYFSKIQDGEKDPLMVPTTKYPRSVRGGGYTETAVDLRCANRLHSDPSWNKRDPQIPKSKWWLTDAASVGLRVVRPFKSPTPEEAEAFYDKFSSK
jgi:formylglycine-generating enzyme required for sulfatase activity